MTPGPADTRDLALGDALAAKRLHEVLDAAGGDALYVGQLHDGEQDPLAAPARFEQGGEVAALPHLRDLQLQGAHPRVPRRGPVAVAVGDPLRTALAPRPAPVLVATSASITAWISTRSPSRRKLRSASGASMCNSSNTFILSFAIAVASFNFVVDEGDAVALVLPAPAVCYTTSWDSAARGLSTKRTPRWVCETLGGCSTGREAR